jgi:hypothetical protein
MSAGRLLGTVLALALSAPLAAAPADPGLRSGGRPEVRIPFPPIKDWSTLRIELQRTPCYGWCPAYRVAITGDGTVTYFGERFVASKGSKTAKIAPENVRALVQAFVAADFFWTFDQYQAPITDLPTQIISISFDGHSKKIVDYAGGHVGMPKAIDALEDAVDAAAGTAVWVGQVREE